MMAGNVRPYEHFLFREYSVGVKQWLIDNIYLSSYPDNNNVTIAYTTPDRAWAKYIYPTLNGATTSPNINFHLTGYEYAQSENMLGFVKEYKTLNDGSGKLKAVRAPLVYKLTYSATIYTRNQPEMDVILYQLLSRAHKNSKGVIIVDGQWGEIEASDPRDETNLEPGEAQSMINRFGIDLMVARAYVPLSYNEVNSVGNFEFEYDV